MRRRTILKRIGATSLAAGVAVGSAAADDRVGTASHEHCHLDDCSQDCPYDCRRCYC